MSVPVACIKMKFSIFLAALLLFYMPASAQDEGLTQDNIRAFYTTMQNMNTGIKEGFEDLNIWLDYLNQSFAEDFQYHTVSYENCSDSGVTMDAMDKQKILDIYKNIGIDNFENYEITVQEIDIHENQMSADVNYTIDIHDVVEGTAFHVHCDGRATHKWDSESGRAVIQSQRCDEHMVFGGIPEGCDKFKEWE